MATPIPDNRATFDASEIARETGGAIVSGDGTTRVIGVTTDSRAAGRGTLFVALAGESFDGHEFAQKAIDAGAAAIVVGKGRGAALTGACVIEVDDTLVALGNLARAHLRAWRVAPGRTVLAITGTAGKTTTKEIAAALFAAHGKTAATKGNLNNRIGVPSTIFTIERDHVHAVIETGMSVRGEIAELGRIVEPNAAIVTNIGIGHAEGVGGTKSDVAREKGAIYASLRAGGIAIANADDEHAMKEVARSSGARTITFGRAGEHSPEYALSAREVNERGQTFSFTTKKDDFTTVHRTVTMPLPSQAQAIDLLSALAAVEALTHRMMSAVEIENAMSKVAMQGRLTMVRLGDGTLLIDDTYNANPESMRVAIAALSEAAGKDRRKVAILGEMKELGPDAPIEHEKLGDVLADHGIDLAVGAGGLVTRALDRAEARGVVVHRADSTERAEALAGELVKPGDVVLVKASRSVGTERIVKALIDSRGKDIKRGIEERG